MDPNMMEMTQKSKFFIYYRKYMLIVGTLGQLLFFTQAIKIFVTRSANDVSLIGFSCGLVSVTSWMIYGFLIKDKPLIVSNIVAMIGALLVIAGILIFGDLS